MTLGPVLMTDHPSERTPGPVVTIRCCRDWPIHAVTLAMYGPGRCGLCGERPERTS